ncbi:hypothetical protein OpiT1DRAFT_05764 [Opitutaceae bacterium TAV1]|nr:hypothetical protein OpiT1DRAFT_05764 [Opitutaceae bacterium TAV1]
MKTYLTTVLTTGLLAVLTFTSNAAAVTVSETFDGTWPGTAANGWSSPWVETKGDGVALSATIKNTAPLAGNGNYLAVSLSATSANSATVNRAITEASSGINTAAAYQITFDFRLDQDFTANQQVFLYAAPGSSSVTSASVSWSIVGDTTNGWRLNNGNKNGSVIAQVKTNVAVTTGVIYSFTIDVDPSTRTWSASITSSAGDYTNTGDAFGFRTAADTMTSPKLSFGGTPGNATDATLNFSIDSVNITQVPEPARTALVWAGFGLLATIIITCGRRHHA